MNDEIRFARRKTFFQSYRPWGLDISSAAKLVYVYLNDRGGSNDRAWPKVKTISEETGLSERSVRYATAELSQKGLIVKKARYRKEDKKQTSNMYLIFPPDQPFNPDIEEIDGQGNVVPLIRQIQYIGLQNMQAQNIALQNMQGDPANIADQELYSVEESVVVESVPKYKNNKSCKEDGNIKIDKHPIDKAELAKLIIDRMKTIGVHVRTDDALDIVFDNEYTTEYICERFDHLLTELPNIKKNVVGWFRKDLNRYFRNQLPIPAQEHAEQNKTKGKNRKNSSKNYNRKDNRGMTVEEKKKIEERKNLIKSLYMN